MESFRELLAMPRAEREQFLSTKPPESRKQIQAKLREYESLRPDQREFRLKITELRWYLLPLLHSSSTNRAAQLQRLPESQRELVATRIREWDALPAEAREELLRNEATLQYFTEMASPNPQPISEARRQKLEAGIAEWQTLPEDRRRRIAQQFNKFFELTPEEKAKALTVVSEAERRQIDKTLKAYEKLPEQQRQQCVQSLHKFASLPIEERQDFLKNAERWKLMTPEERQSWRELVSRLSSQQTNSSTLVRPSPAEQIRKRIQAMSLAHATNRTATNLTAQFTSSSPPAVLERMSNAPSNSPPAKANPAME